MCHRIGLPPTSTIGFGLTVVSSLSRVPSPPASMTAFMLSPIILSWRRPHYLLRPGYFKRKAGAVWCHRPCDGDLPQLLRQQELIADPHGALQRVDQLRPVGGGRGQLCVMSGNECVQFGQTGQQQLLEAAGRFEVVAVGVG